MLLDVEKLWLMYSCILTPETVTNAAYVDAKETERYTA